MRASTKVNLSVPGKPSVEIGGGTKNHANLKNLGFEESGHTGFQPALTEEQLKNIEDVVKKEDISNKLQSINEITGDEAEYFSANAMVGWISNVESRNTKYVHSYVDYIVGGRIETGSYIGTGTIGEDNPTVLTFGSEPLYVAILTHFRPSDIFYFGLNNIFVNNNSSINYVMGNWVENNDYNLKSDLMRVQFNGNKLYIYPGAFTTAASQLNCAGDKYFYIALLKNEV